MQNIEVALKLVDKFSAELRKMGEAVQGLEGTIQKQVKQMNSHFDHLQSSISKTAQSTQKHFQGMQNGMSAMSTNFVKNALAMGAGIFAIDKAAEALMSFDDARARVVGLAGLNKDQTKQLTASALQIGGSTEFSGTDVMSAYAITARTIKDVKEIEAITKIQTDLASLGQTTITDIAQNSTALVGILGLNSKNIANFGDIIAQMTTKNSASITANLEAMTLAIPMMQAYGQTFKDTAALLSVAPKSTGISGSELGTAMRSMVTGLNQTVRLARSGSERDASALRMLGLTPDQLDLTKNKLIDVLTTLQKARNRDGSAINGAQLNTLLGDYGQVLGTGLIRDIDKIKEVRVELDNVKGKLGEMSAPMRETLRANLGNALGAVEALIVKMGDAGLTGAIITMANAFEAFFNFLANNPIIVNIATEVLLLVAGLWSLRKIVGIAMLGVGFFTKALASLRLGLILTGGVLPALQIGLTTLFTTIRTAFTANPLGVLVTGIMLAVEAVRLLIFLWKKLKGETDIVQPVQGGQSQAIQGGAFWQTKDGQMTPYTQQSKQKITTDVNVIFENPPEGTKAIATQRGTSGVDVGTTNILKDLTKGLGF